MLFLKTIFDGSLCFKNSKGDPYFLLKSKSPKLKECIPFLVVSVPDNQGEKIQSWLAIGWGLFREWSALVESYGKINQPLQCKERQ